MTFSLQIAKSVIPQQTVAKTFRGQIYHVKVPNIKGTYYYAEENGKRVRREGANPNWDGTTHIHRDEDNWYGLERDDKEHNASRTPDHWIEHLPNAQWHDSWHSKNKFKSKITDAALKAHSKEKAKVTTILEKEFAEFGFRHLLANGIGLGEVNRIKELQKSLSYMADLIGLSKTDMSFSGALTMSVDGSKGEEAGRSWGVSEVKAAYDPRFMKMTAYRKGSSQNMIHEWAHFMDHIMGIYSENSELIKNNVKGEGIRDYVARSRSYPFASNETGRENYFSGHEEMAQSYRDLVKSFDEKDGGGRSYLDRMKDLDERDNMGKYYQHNFEMFARAFHKWVLQKDKKNVFQNEDGNENIPTDKEMEAISPHFDRLLKAIKDNGIISKSMKLVLEINKSVPNQKDSYHYEQGGSPADPTAQKHRVSGKRNVNPVIPRPVVSHQEEDMSSPVESVNDIQLPRKSEFESFMRKTQVKMKDVFSDDDGKPLYPTYDSFIKNIPPDDFEDIVWSWDDVKDDFYKIMPQPSDELEENLTTGEVAKHALGMYRKDNISPDTQHESDLKNNKSEGNSRNVLSAQFKDWFGDWQDHPDESSKVVDANGYPIPVYHGTKSDFETFKLQPGHKRNGTVAGDGFYFTEDKDIANNFSISDDGRRNTLTAYLNIRNPFDFDKSFTSQEIGDIRRKLSRYDSSHIYGRPNMNVNLTFFDKSIKERGREDGSVSGYGLWKSIEVCIGNEDANKFLGKIKYDGICHRNSSDEGQPYDPDSDNDTKYKGKSWVAFKPNQIKSVNNKGSFNPRSLNIYKSHISSYTKKDGTFVREHEDKRTPFTEKAKAPKVLYHTSNPANRESIKTQGIIPSKGPSYESHFEGQGDLPEAVFASGKPYDSTWHDDVWKIDTTRLRHDWHKDNSGPEDSFVTHEAIPGHAIKLIRHGTGKDSEDLPDPKKDYKDNGTDAVAFKGWFGDSKVKDKDGNPQVVYHGTDQKFNSFDPKKSTQGLFWFTTDMDYINRGEYGKPNPPHVVKAYLKISNPAGWEEYDKKTLDQLISDGHDGLALPDENGHVIYAAFDPEQIKSVDNKGTFDPTSKNIMKSSGFILKSHVKGHMAKNPSGIGRHWVSDYDDKRSKAIEYPIPEKFSGYVEQKIDHHLRNQVGLTGKEHSGLPIFHSVDELPPVPKGYTRVAHGTWVGNIKGIAKNGIVSGNEVYGKDWGHGGVNAVGGHYSEGHGDIQKAKVNIVADIPDDQLDGASKALAKQKDGVLYLPKIERSHIVGIFSPRWKMHEKGFDPEEFGKDWSVLSKWKDEYEKLAEGKKSDNESSVVPNRMEWSPKKLQKDAEKRFSDPVDWSAMNEFPDYNQEKAYRVDTADSPSRWNSVADAIVREREELDNDEMKGIGDSAMHELDKLPHYHGVWVCKTSEDASRYLEDHDEDDEDRDDDDYDDDEEGEISELTIPAGSKVLADDGDNGYFVVMPPEKEKISKAHATGYPLQGRTTFQGLDISIENRRGSVRSGIDPDGKPWKVKMKAPYGYIRMTEGVDKEPGHVRPDAIDVYVGNNKNARYAYIVDQLDCDGKKFDEQKTFLGFNTMASAKRCYFQHMKNKKCFGSIKRMPMAEFKRKVLATLPKGGGIVKSHVKAYTKKDGTFVQAHEDKRVKKQKFYHGTQYNFDKVEMGKRSGFNSTIFGGEPVERHGLFFTAEKNVAQNYAGKNGHVHEVNLDINNPIDLRDGFKEKDLASLENAGFYRNYFENKPVDEHFEMFDGQDGKDFVDHLKKQGYDGAIIKDTDGDSYIVFDNNQVIYQKNDINKSIVKTHMAKNKNGVGQHLVRQHERHLMWHGTPSGDLRGGTSGLHVGTRQAAKEALEARIGFPAEGEWDGTREYGSTLLAGKNSIVKRDRYGVTGYNSKAPDHDYYAHEHPEGLPTHSNGDPIKATDKPDIFPLKITGKMTNHPSYPMEDFKANGTMRGMLKRGKAKSGYYYENVGEESGSVSAVLPSEGHIKKLSKWKTHIDEGPKNWEAGKYDLTRTDQGIVSPHHLKDIPGASDEHKLFDKNNGGRYNTQEWEDFKDALKNGEIKPQVTVHKEKDGRVHVWEGNHRIRAAQELGIPLDVEMKYFGNSQKQGLVPGLHPDQEEFEKSTKTSFLLRMMGIMKSNHEPAGKTEINPVTGKTIKGGQFAPLHGHSHLEELLRGTPDWKGYEKRVKPIFDKLAENQIITTVEYNNSKSTMNVIWEMQAGWKAKMAFYDRYNPESNGLRRVYSQAYDEAPEFDYPHSIVSPNARKKIEKFIANNPVEWAQKYGQHLLNMIPVAKAYVDAKANLVSPKDLKSVKKENETKAKAEEFVKKPVAAADIEKVRLILTDITQKAYDSMVEFSFNSKKTYLDKYKSTRNPGQDIYRWMNEQYGKATYGKVNHAREDAMRVLAPLIDREGEVKHDADKTMKEMAENDVKFAHEQFINKVISKVSPILLQKELEGVKILNGRYHGIVEAELQFDFKDGASFQLRNQIVWKYNYNGTSFYQFPSTFHSVVTASGEKIAKPSEAIMNNKFLEDKGTIEKSNTDNGPHPIKDNPKYTFNQESHRWELKEGDPKGKNPEFEIPEGVKISRMFEHDTCDRCGGKGRIDEYSGIHGGVCYGCNGQGIKHSKAGKEGLSEYQSHTNKKISDLKVGDQIYERPTQFMKGGWLQIQKINENGSVDAVKVNNPDSSYHGIHPDSVYTIKLTREETLKAIRKGLTVQHNILANKRGPRKKKGPVGDPAAKESTPEVKAEAPKEKPEEKKVAEPQPEAPKEDPKPVSQYQGKVGDKISFTARCTGNYGFHNGYGETYINQFEDKDGNKYVWRTTSGPVKKGRVMEIEGKVKAHGEYNGTKQTELSHVKTDLDKHMKEYEKHLMKWHTGSDEESKAAKAKMDEMDVKKNKMLDRTEF